MYYVLFTDAALEDLEALNDPRTKSIIIKIVNKELKDSPKTKGKPVGREKVSGLFFYEKRFFFGAGYRVYYNVINESVVVDKIEYEGTSMVKGASTKKTQRKVLKRLGFD